MIDERFSETAEYLLEQLDSLHGAEKTETIFFMTTYLMNFAGLMLAKDGEPVVGARYLEITRQVEDLMQQVRQRHVRQSQTRAPSGYKSLH